MKKKIGITLAVVMLLVCIISVACLAGCKEKVTAENAQTATEANWAKIDNKSAKTSVTITDAEIALGVNGSEKAVSIKASAQIDLVRTWKDGVLTIDITAKPTKITPVVLDKDLTDTVLGMLEETVNLSKLTSLTFTGQAFYNYGSEEKTIGVRNLKVTGLKSAIPALKDVTDDWDIKFKSGDSYVSEVSYNLSSLDLANNPTVGGILKGLFNEGYNLDLIGIIEGLLLNQTMLDFSNASGAAYENNHYEASGIKVSDNLNFISEVWDQIKSKDALNDLIGDLAIDDVKIGNAVVDIPVAGILKQIIGKDTLANLLPDLLAKIEGNMTVSGDVDGGVFTSLDATLAGTKISLTQENVNYIVDNVVNPILGGISMDEKTVRPIVNNVIDKVTKGTAYISLGTITVSSTFTVE